MILTSCTMEIEIKRSIKQIMERVDELEGLISDYTKALTDYTTVEELIQLKMILTKHQGELESLYWIIGGKPLPF